MTNIDIRTANLEQSYLDSSISILRFQQYVQLVLIQQRLDLPGDAGLAFRVKELQSQFKNETMALQGWLIQSYIDSLASASNFCNLFGSFIVLGKPLLQQSSEDSKRMVSALSLVLSESASHINQKTDISAQNLDVTYNNLSGLLSDFNRDIDKAIKDLGDSAIAASQEIETLQKAISKNISDIVEGGNVVGGAVRDLGIGILTQIVVATNTGKPPTGGGTKVPSGSFVVSAISGAQEGTTQTLQARADLNANNQKLAATYQKLERANSLITVAKVVQVQNQMLVAEIAVTRAKILAIATDWGQFPDVRPPGSGVSLGFYQFAKRVEAITAPADAALLVKILQDATISWNSLLEKLNDIKRTFTGV